MSGTRIIFGALALWLVTSAMARADWSNPPRRPPAGVQHETFASAAARTRQPSRTRVGYNIALPAEYSRESARRFPVVYYLHGYKGDESSYLEYANYWRQAVRQFGPVILVFVNGGETSFFTDSPEGAVPGETVVKELVAHIDRNYRTIAEAKGRSLHGYSMGGFGALKLAFKHPEWFGSVVAFGATLADAREFQKHLGNVYERTFANDARRFAESDPVALAERHAEKIRGRLAIQIIVGARDEFLPRNRALHEALERLKVPHTFREVPGAKHKKDDLYESGAALGAFEFSAKGFKGE
jgi:S-formylglutathione hydrolase FrmB